jgi:hypothetical protein
MNWFKGLFAGGVSEVVDGIAHVADRFIETPDERSAFKLQVKSLVERRNSELEQTLRAELGAKERILVAELKQGDAYTKRARPSVVYVGLVFIGINYVLVPLVSRLLQFKWPGLSVEPLADLPVEFWAAWGGICTTWVIGRSAEKRGSRNRAIEAVTGNPSTHSLLD